MNFATSTEGWKHRRASRGLIDSTYRDRQPQYSADGRHIALQSNCSGDIEIWLANSDGSSQRQLTHLHATLNGYSRWSPDGKYILKRHRQLCGHEGRNLFRPEDARQPGTDS